MQIHGRKPSAHSFRFSFGRRLLVVGGLLALPALAEAKAKGHARSLVKDYIIGGQEVGPSDPIRQSTIGLYQPSPDGHGGALCTASVIRKGIALTAAHCIEPGEKPVLLFGRDLHSPETIRRQATAVAVNPKWQSHAGRGMDQGDIALVKFGGSIPEGYRKISTAASDADITAGATTTLAGYGVSNAQTHEGAGILRKAQVQILKNRPGKSEMILNQSHGRGACHGDSGGPAFINEGGKMILAGVTNRGYPNSAPDDCRHQVIYTKVPAYKKWIQTTEKALDATKSSPGILMARNDRSVERSGRGMLQLGERTRNKSRKKPALAENRSSRTLRKKHRRN